MVPTIEALQGRRLPRYFQYTNAIDHQLRYSMLSLLGLPRYRVSGERDSKVSSLLHTAHQRCMTSRFPRRSQIAPLQQRNLLGPLARLKLSADPAGLRRLVPVEQVSPSTLTHF